MDLGAIVEVSSKCVNTQIKRQKNSKNVNDHCNRLEKAKMLSSKFFEILMYFLKMGCHNHMLRFLSEDEFEVKLVHQRSPIFTTAYISLFEEMDKRMKGSRYIGQENYNEKCRVRFKSNMRKMVKAGYLKQLDSDKSNDMRSVIKIRYKILKGLGNNELEDVKINENSVANISDIEMSVENTEENTKAVSHFLCLSETRRPRNEVVQDLILKNIHMEGCNVSEEGYISENNETGEGHIAAVENSVSLAHNFNQDGIIENAVIIIVKCDDIGDYKDFTSNEENTYKRRRVHEENDRINEEICFYDEKINSRGIDSESNFFNKTIQNVNLNSTYSVVPSAASVNSSLQDEETTYGELRVKNEISSDINTVPSVVSSCLNVNGPFQNKEIAYGGKIAENEMSVDNEAWQYITERISILEAKDAMKSTSNPFLPNVCSVDENYLLDNFISDDTDEIAANGF